MAQDNQMTAHRVNSGMELRLLGGFRLSCRGTPLDPPMASQRILALLAMNPGWLSRSYVAGTLWLDVSDSHAMGSLRSALWRLRTHQADLVDTRAGRIALANDVTVDVGHLLETCRLLDSGEGSNNIDDDLFAHDLLPDWYDDWVLLERERLRQVRLRGLETRAHRLIEVGDYSGAVRTALAAVQCEPLRESSHRVLIQAHIEEGNFSEAIRQFQLFARLLENELGINPSRIMYELVAPLMSNSIGSRARLLVGSG